MDSYWQASGSAWKRARGETVQVGCIGSTHGYLLSGLWGESGGRVTRQAAGGRQRDVRWLQVRVWHDLSYIAPVPLLAHGLTVKLSPFLCSRISPAGRIAACLCGYYKCNLLRTPSGTPQAGSASF